MGLIISQIITDFKGTVLLSTYVEYKGNYKEDYVFNILHENAFYIGDTIVDINPINEDYSYSMTEYLRNAEAYHRANTKKTSR